MKKRIGSLMLALCLVIAMFSFSRTAAYATASDDYTQWKQTDAAWNEEKAWPSAPYKYMSDAGCWVTSVAMLLRHYGVVEEDIDGFNPWICNAELMQVGAVDNNGDMDPTKIKEAYSEFTYAGYADYSFSALKEKFDAGYACMVLVNNGGHMVAVRYVSDDDVIIMDPGSRSTKLSQLSGVTAFYYFGPFDEIPTSASYVYENERNDFEITPTLATVTIANEDSYLKSLPYSIKTTEASISLNNDNPIPVGTELTIDALAVNSVGNIWYKTSYRGQTGYLYSGDVTVTELLFDLCISGASYPSGTLKKGSAYPIAGKITTSHNLELVTVAIYKASNTKTSPIMEKSAEIDHKQTYSISSALDNAMTFNTLASGDYTFVIRVTEMVDDPINNICYSRTVDLVSQSFTVK